MPPTIILPESNIASNDAATSNNDDNSTKWDSKPSVRPKGNVQAMQQMTVKVAFLC
jgi:hypothetical protein